jgi:arginyl-tRNA synthetase
MNILNEITFEVSKVLKKYSIEDKTELRISGYKNYDYQINTLVQYQSHDSIDLLLNDVSKVLDESQLIQSYDIADNLFINLSIDAASIIQSLQNPVKNLRAPKIQNIIIDYGGPNIGKPLHVGHLRPLNIGRSIYQMHKTIGNNIFSDIHLGDWGMPVAQIIAYCEVENINLETLSIEKLEIIYPEASKKYSNDQSFKKISQAINKQLSQEDLATVSKWRIIKNLTVGSLKETLHLLNHDFDHWWGESSVNDLIPDMLNNLVKEGKLEEDEGAFISAELTEPRILVTKSDGSYLYITTDLATVLLRNQEIPHEKVLYVTDNRQKLHFKQLFQSIKFFDFPSKKYNHVGFGTINDSNGNPLKTRDGGNLKLVNLYQQTFKYIEEINSTLSETDLHCLTNTVLTYSDLLTNRKTDYKFDLEKFTSVSGKTGIYVQYAQVRAKKLIETLSEEKPTLQIPSTPLGPLDRKLIIALANIEFHLELSLKNNEPHHLANYLYDISNAFNTFYQDSNIKKIDDDAERNQKIFITSLFIEYSHLVMSCLGITPVEKM